MNELNEHAKVKPRIQHVVRGVLQLGGCQLLNGGIDMKQINSATAFDFG